MDSTILNDYIDKIYGYAINKTYSRDEADELAQEILYTAVRELPKLRNPDSFEGWLWGVANNVTRTFRRYMGKQHAMYSYDTLESITVTDEYSFEYDDTYEMLRSKIAMLSKLYRDIIILRYYDNLSVRQIAEKLNIPEGTVTWRLSEGRNKLKKECMNMTETALRPIELNIQISGSGDYNGKSMPFPNTLINDALSQNIMYHCYKEPKTIEDLAKLCGVPAFFIESAVSKLLDREAVTEPSKGKYLTDFIIYSKEHVDYTHNTVPFVEGIVDKYVEVLKSFTREIIDLGVYTAGKSEDELVYLYGMMALEHLNDKFNPNPRIPYKVKYDGYAWAYHAHFGEVHRKGIGYQKNMNIGGNGGTYSQWCYSFSGFTFRPMVYDYHILLCEEILNKEELPESKKELASEMIESGHLSNVNGEITVKIPAFTFAQKAEFDKLTEEYFSEFIPKYAEAVKKFTAGYKKLFPKHLSDDADRIVYNYWLDFFANVTDLAQEKGLLPRPEPNTFCDVLVQWKDTAK